MNNVKTRFLLLKMALAQWTNEQMIKAADNNGFALIDYSSLI
jgi:hypothetical protein